MENLNLIKAENLPVDNDASAISWFSTKPITPQNNISITDLSNFTPENSYSSNINASNINTKNKLVFANELGILEDSNGNTLFDSSDISVSDTFLNVEMYDKKYFIKDIEKNKFIHSYYISKHYTLTQRDIFSFKSLNDFVPQTTIPKSIKVIDRNGQDYVDPNTGLPKYRILLDQLNLSIYADRQTLPTKIIVLLDEPNPTDLILVYDKVALSSNEQVSSLSPQYKENINVVSFFNRALEESLLIDNSFRNKKLFSKKSISGKNNLINSVNHNAEGFEIFVPKKALADNRTYESFNWRLVTKVKRSVNVSTVNNGEEIDSEFNLKQKVVNCAVLCTSAQLTNMLKLNDYSSANPYIFLRLQNSPFNTSKYSFVNPLAQSGTPNNTAAYWLLDVDSVADADLALFDILAWSPTSAITTNQGLKLKKFVQNTQGTLVLDLSQSITGAEVIDPSLSVSTDQYSLDTWTYNTSNLMLDENKNNAWPINSSIFETLTIDSTNYTVYSIFGRSNLSNLTTSKTAKEFNGNFSPSNIVLKNSRGNPLFVSLEYALTADSLSKGIVLASTTQFLKYCNDVYQPSSIFDTALSNSKDTAISETVFTATAAIEGPMKLLYNSVSIALLARAFSGRVQDIRSSIYYQISNWNSSYVINGNVLLEEEKKEEYTAVKETTFDPIGVTKYAKNILTQGDSILSYYKKVIYDYLSDQHSLSLQEIDLNNLEFYIEVTNPDVIIANSTKVVKDYTSSDVNEIPSSYTLYAISKDNINSTAYAYTDGPSAQFIIPGGFGPYVIRERNHRTSSIEINNKLSNLISTTASYKSYPFNFSIFNSYTTSSESPLQFSANWSTQISATYTASLSREELMTIPAHDEVTPTPGTASGLTSDQNNDSIYSLESKASGFTYSGDIDAGNVTVVYEVGKAGMLTDYIKYIQITLREAGYNCLLNAKYDTGTANAVRQFQLDQAGYEDGKIDSQTKSFMAKFWRNMDAATYEGIVARVRAGANSGAAKFITAARGSVAIDQLASVHPFKKITYTGSTAPAVMKDTIYTYLPTKYKSSPFSDVVINSITVSPGAFPGNSGYTGITINEISAVSPSGAFKIIKGKDAIGHKSTTYPVNLPLSDYDRFAIDLTGAKLGGKFGSYASGYSIYNITFSISYVEAITTTVPATTEYVQRPTTTKEVTIIYEASGAVSEISANKAAVIDLSGLRSVKYTNKPISMTYPVYNGPEITYNTLDLTKTTIDFSNTNYKPPYVPSGSTDPSGQPTYRNESITIDLTSSKTVNVVSNTLSVSNVLSLSNNPVTSSSISASVVGNVLTFETSALNYTNSNVTKSSEKLLDNFWLLKSDGSIIENSKNTISVLDGLLLLCKPSSASDSIGKPYGIDVQSFVKALPTNLEYNVDYGSFILINNSPNNGGMIYGFYDKNKKEFLGTNLYYADYINRGPDNIYIGVLAIDADGNLSNSVDIFGPKTSNIIPPANIPVKMACPIYNVEYIPSSRIGPGSIPANLSKYQQWPFYVTSGSFTKDIYIDPAYGWTNWAKKYTGKTLRATYSTLDVDGVVWSSIAGRPYIDVVNETPIILSAKRMQLTQVPLASFAEPSYNKAGIINQWITFEKRDSILDEWVYVESNLIKDINCSTGIVDFTVPITEDPNLIRVTYTVKANGIPVKHVNGRPIPVNPFLNKDLVEPEKALHIYIKPSKIEVKNSENNSYIWNFVSEYTYDAVLDFTYDPSIFDPYNSVNYDPFAIQIALLRALSSVDIKDLGITDLRVRGGGIKSTLGKTVDVQSYGSLDINKVFTDVPEASSFWDIYPPEQQAYPKGGYVIIKLPRSVLDNFNSEQEVYGVINRNITAGVAYKIQDMDGNDWGVF